MAKTQFIDVDILNEATNRQIGKTCHILEPHSLTLVAFAFESINLNTKSEFVRTKKLANQIDFQ